MTEEAPLRIGRYEVLARLAVGGMAELFLAREQGIAGLERLVVLKRILPHLADRPSFVDMFLREARIVARLAHPNVVQIFDLGEEGGTFYIAMEYIHGTTVRELQILCEKQHRAFPVDVAVAIMLQALRGLHSAHELAGLDGKRLGLVHRDVSPHNLMCTTDGHVKLLDFGVAKATEDSLESTQSGNLKGKFAYMSPEQARRQTLDRRSDIFGAGIVFWETLTGQRLFKRESEIEMMEALFTADIHPPSRVAAVPPELDDIVLFALARERDRRWSTAEEMRTALYDVSVRLGMNISAENVARFIADVAGDHLAQREEALHQAMERKALTVMERQNLLHATGSESSASRDVEAEIARVAELRQHSRTSSAIDEVPANATGETVVSKHLEQRPSPTATKATPPRKRSDGERRILFLGAAIFVALLAVAALLALELTEQTTETETAEPVLLGEPLPWAFAPTVDPELLRAEIEPLRKYIQERTGRPVSMEVTKSYAESSRMLLEGKVAFAVLPPLMYVRTHSQNERIEPLAVKYFDGASHSDGLLLVRGDSGLAKVEDLEGKKFCFTDRNSTTGNFLPRAHLRQLGYEPSEFIGSVHWSGDHIQALRDILDDKCDAAAVYNGAFIAADKLDIPVSRLRTLAITGNVPQDAVVAGAEVSEGDKRAVREALLEFDPRKELGIERLGDTQRITGFHEVDDEDFDELRKVIVAAGEAAE